MATAGRVASKEESEGPVPGSAAGWVREVPTGASEEILARVARRAPEAEAAEAATVGLEADSEGPAGAESAAGLATSRP